MKRFIVLNQMFINDEEADCGTQIFKTEAEAIKEADNIFAANKGEYLSITIIVKEISDITFINEEDFENYVDEYWFELMYSNEYLLKLES